MTICDVPVKQQATIARLCPSLDSAVAQRLEEMGFAENALIICIRRTPFNGPIVYQVGDCVYSLEPAIAKRIYIA